MVTQNNFVILCHCRQDTDRMTIMISCHCNRSRLYSREVCFPFLLLLPSHLTDPKLDRDIGGGRGGCWRWQFCSREEKEEMFQCLCQRKGETKWCETADRWLNRIRTGTETDSTICEQGVLSQKYSNYRILWLPQDNSQGVSSHKAIRAFLGKLAMLRII